MKTNKNTKHLKVSVAVTLGRLLSWVGEILQALCFWIDLIDNQRTSYAW